MPQTTSPFNLPESRAAKVDPALTADDERHFAAIDKSLLEATARLSRELHTARKEPVRLGQEAVERDAEIRRLEARLRALERFGLDLCLGRMDPVGTDPDRTDPDRTDPAGTDTEAGSGPLYIGRLGLTNTDGHRLLTDWRAPAAEPFFGATHANPMGLAGRRRYRWTQGRITDYWDEAFILAGDSTPSGGGTGSGSAEQSTAALEDLSAFIASLGSSRSTKMQDVLGTIAADQDAIIRAPARGTLVVDGGPGTGKTVVALHRAAYLIYSDPRVGHHPGGVLFVGPHQPYLNYVADVLPSLGEEGVQTCMLRHLVPEGALALDEPEPLVARLKSSAGMVQAVEAAVRFYERPPTSGMEVATPYADMWLGSADWAEAFDAPGPGIPHNEARDEVWDALLTILVDRYDGDDVPEAVLRRAFTQNAELAQAFGMAWPLLQHTDLVGDLWRVPAYLRLCAPWLNPDEIRLLQRGDPSAWTDADLPLLDAARHLLGDPEESQRRRRQRAVVLAERELMDQVVEDLIAADDSELLVMSMLRGEDMAEKLADGDAAPVVAVDALAGPFGHIVVDEAQELSDAQWQMLLQRCPSRSFTIVGDRAQARRGFAESWPERLERVGLGKVAVASLQVNYRTPTEVMVEASQAIRTALPDANVPLSIRSSGIPVTHAAVSELGVVLEGWLVANTEGIVCVIGAGDITAGDAGTHMVESPRVSWLAPELAKGLEFDLVILVQPERFGTGIGGAVDRYVAMTRATRQLVVLS